jgi:hypothetical protein
LFNASQFTGGFENMSIINADTDTLDWGTYNIAGETLTYEAQGEVLGSASWTSANGPLSPDNWIISPVLDLSNYDAATFTFGRGTTYAFQNLSEKYAVYAVNPADPATLGSTLNAATALLVEQVITPDQWVSKTVDLTALAGQANVYVAIRHFDCTDYVLLFIDDLVVSATSSASIKENNLNVSVYPTPANDVVNFKLNGEATSVSIIGLDGKVYSTTSISGNTTSVNVASLASGIYVYEIVAENGSVTRSTFVKK